MIHEEARIDYLESYKWYNKQEAGLGDKFAEHIERAINRIQHNPEHYPKKKKDYREIVVDVFPYIISYQIFKEQNFIHVSAIHHGKRNPKLKYRKFREL